MAEPEHHPSISSALSYKDPKAALKWLEEAFGFEPFMVILSADDELMHSEMRFGDGVIMVGSEWSPMHKSPTKHRRLQYADGSRAAAGGCRRAL